MTQQLIRSNPVVSTDEQEARRLMTLELFRQAQTADSAAVAHLHEKIVLAHIDVARAIARKYSRGTDTDDLNQIAYIGLIQATHRFDVSLETDFLAFCVPTIRGEVKRYLRDHSWFVRPPRRIQELGAQIRQTHGLLANALGREPTPAEYAEFLEEDLRSVQEALQSQESFQAISLDSKRGSTFARRLPPAPDAYATAEVRVILHRAWPRLNGQERTVVYLRFVEDRTQAEIGMALDITQMQVSRILRRVLDRLREEIG